jgi:hydrogenase 3 maturation protease
LYDCNAAARTSGHSSESVMEDSLKDLAARLKGKRFGVVGVGNVMKGDDGAGPELVAELLRRGFTLPCVDATEVPENYGGWVPKQELEAVVFIDAVDFGGEPGECRVIPFEHLMISASNTHRMSLHYTVMFLRDEWEGDAILVGVQPKRLTLGEGLSEEVAAGVDKLATVLYNASSRI